MKFSSMFCAFRWSQNLTVIIVRIVRLYFVFCSFISTFACMNSKLIKLDAPYNVIYAGGKVGRHIATLMVWNDDDEMAGGIIDAASYPVIDEGEEFPAGTLIDYAELHDCRVLCPPNGTNLYWVAKMIEYDFQQLEPAGSEYILERMKLLGCKIVMPDTTCFEATLSIMPLNGSWEEPRLYRVKSNRCEGFYFQSEGTVHEIQNDLQYQLSAYQAAFNDELSTIRFRTNDMELDDVIKYMNESQGIKG